MVSPVLSPFVWGDDGKPKSPAQVQRDMAIAQALSNARPQAEGFWGAVGQIGNAAVGNVLQGRADADYEAGRQSAADLFAGLSSNSSPDAISAALLNPAAEWATPGQTAVGEALFNTQLERSDPAYQLDLAYKQAQLDALRNPVAENPYLNVGGGSIFNTSTGEFMSAPGMGMTDLPADVQEYNWYAEGERAAGREPLPYLDFVNAQRGAGLSVTTNPDGTTTVTQGGPAKALTEAQSKDAVYFTRASAALPVVDQLESALLNYGEYAADAVPAGLGNYLKSEDYQVAQNAGREFLASILRKDTGAAVTPSEEKLYGDIFLPRPGDKPATLERKRQARAVALAAIEAGMPPQAIANAAAALEKTGAGNIPSSPTPQSDQVIDAGNGITIRRIGN